MQQTAQAAQDVTVNIAGVGRAANEAGSAASQVLGAAGKLTKQSASLSKEVNSFVTQVRQLDGDGTERKIRRFLKKRRNCAFAQGARPAGRHLVTVAGQIFGGFCEKSGRKPAGYTEGVIIT